MAGNQHKWEKMNKAWFWLGVSAVLAAVVPYVILGKDAIFTYHDQLDGELIAYLLQAKHLFQGDVLPEFMGGLSKTALTLPAPLGVFLFLGGDGYVGLVIMLLVGRLAGYLGMYLLCRETVKEPWIAALSGGLYALIPFLPIYGLSQFGIPLLFWCILQLKDRQHVVLSLCYVALYTLCSSLVLVGFGLLGMGAVLLVWWLLRKRSASLALPAAAWAMMLVLYVAENFRLLWQLMGGGAVSHKAEYALHASPFLSTFMQGFGTGTPHSQDAHIWLCVLAVLAAMAWLIRGRTEKETALLRIMAFCLCWNILFALAAALWESSAGVWLRSRLSVLKAFQMDRLLWIAPCLWYLFGACGIALIWRWILQRRIKVFGILLAAAGMLAVCVTGVRLLLDGDVKFNVQKLLRPDYPMLSFRDYYAIGVMDQVKEFLCRETGQTQEAYRVVSLGIDPAAALYHGFYCLDGYSNNYPLEYKHTFRKILSPELEKSDYLREYFDAWGNRCYLFSSETMGYYTVEKNGFWFQNYELDTDALRAMGGKYLLSAAYILNAQEQGLKLLWEEPFETEDSYYRIFVYEVE